MSSASIAAIAALTRREQRLVSGGAHGSEAMDLPDKAGAIEAAAAVFAELGVSYALIGGVAVGIRSGVPRATLDVDFAVTSTADRDALASALEGRDFKRKGVFPHSTNFVHRSGEPVQLAFDPGFDAMIARAEAVALGAASVRVVTRDDLIAMKRRAAADPTRRRSKALRDQADIALLEGDVAGPDEGW
jgi:hypothetical protein